MTFIHVYEQQKNNNIFHQKSSRNILIHIHKKYAAISSSKCDYNDFCNIFFYHVACAHIYKKKKNVIGKDCAYNKRT